MNLCGANMVMVDMFAQIRLQDVSLQPCKNVFVCCELQEKQETAIVIKISDDRQLFKKVIEKSAKRAPAVLHSMGVTGLGCWQGKLLLHCHHHYCCLHPLMKSTAEHNMLTQQGKGGLIKVNYNTATCNPCSQYWSSSLSRFPGDSYVIPTWTADVKHQQIVLKYVISAHVGIKTQWSGSFRSGRQATTLASGSIHPDGPGPVG